MLWVVAMSSWSAFMPLVDLADECDLEDIEAKAKQDQRRQQTEKARWQRLLKRAQGNSIHRVIPQSDEASDNWAVRIQKQYFTVGFYTAIHNLKEAPSDKGDTKQLGRERARAVMSLMIQVIKLLWEIMSPPPDSSISHILDCVVLDDTSCRIRGQGDGVPAIYTVMNTVQAIHVCYTDGGCNNFSIPTPYMCLPSQKTEDLHIAYSSGLLLSSWGLGKSFQAVEERLSDQMAKSLQQQINDVPDAWKCQVMVGDALPTNDAVFRMERAVAVHERARSAKKRQLALRMKCQLHQLCLVRKPAVLSIDNFWSTLVRLAHLFEQYSFKRQFALALIQVFKHPGKFRRVLACNFVAFKFLFC